MASVTAPASVANSSDYPEPRRYWQLPTFVIGLAAAYAAFHYVPRPGADPLRSALSDLTELKSALERRPLNIAQIESLLEPVSTAVKSLPDRSSEAAFLVGSGYLALAESEPALNSERWAKAHQFFSQCDPSQLSSDDGNRLKFRSAKAAASQAIGDPVQLLASLNHSPTGEDRSECPRLIAETAIRLTPPDTRRARDELSIYLGGAHRLSTADSARMKLKLAEWNLSLNDPLRARSWLKDIPASAPNDVLAAAKVQLARLAAAENNWAEALKLFEAATATSGLPADQTSMIYYQSGFAMMQLNKPDQAIPYFEQAAKETGPFASSAALRLAELRIRDPRAKGSRSDAVTWLEKAVASPGVPPQIAASEVRTTFEEVIKTCLAEADYASGLRAAVAYAPIAENGKDREYRAEINAAWASSIQASPPRDANSVAQAKEKMLAAAKDYADLADMYPTPAGKADMLRRAASAFRLGGDPAKSMAVIQNLLSSQGVPDEHLSAAWLEKADLLPDVDFDGKKSALEKAMLSPTSSAAEARYRLAMLHLNRSQQLFSSISGSTTPEPTKSEAEAMARLGRDLLSQIADAVTVPPGERATHEEAIFELGRLLMGNGQYSDAATRFRSQLRLYPTGSKSGYGRLWLACCLVSLVASEKTYSPSDARLSESLTLLQPLFEFSDPFLKTQAAIRTLNTLIVMRKLDQVTSKGLELMGTYQGRPEMLVVGKLVFHAYLTSSPAEPGEALKVLDRMETAFQQIPREQFPQDQEYSHDKWKQELASMRATYQQFQATRSGVK